MNPALELATASLEAAKQGIDNPGTMGEAEIHELLDTARRLTARSLEFDRFAALEAVGKAALEELDILEQIRRLLAYGIAQGRTHGEGLKLAALLSSAPRIDKAAGIRGAIPTFTWLRANRSEISTLLSTIKPNRT